MCQCPLGLLPHFYVGEALLSLVANFYGVNALSGCYLISTIDQHCNTYGYSRCQCPLGLLPHFYYTGESTIDIIAKSRVNALSGCYLISTMKQAISREHMENCVNALSGCYLISTVPLQKPRFYAVSRDCFCRYLSEYSDSNSFSCMLTIWTYLMR